MEQQIAVGWLIKKLQNRRNGIFDGLPHLSLDEIYNQAKQMEKEQIMRAYEFGVADPYNFIEDEAEQYYNETYGGQGSPDTSPNTE